MQIVLVTCRNCHCENEEVLIADNQLAPSFYYRHIRVVANAMHSTKWAECKHPDLHITLPGPEENACRIEALKRREAVNERIRAKRERGEVYESD